MVKCAQSLPVFHVPEFDRVQVVLLDVIDLGCRPIFALIKAELAVRILRQEYSSGVSPAATVEMIPPPPYFAPAFDGPTLT